MHTIERFCFETVTFIFNLMLKKSSVRLFTILLYEKYFENILRINLIVYGFIECNFIYVKKEIKMKKFMYFETMKKIWYFSIRQALAINSPKMMHSFMVIFCFHIEFHRMATVINCCGFKKLKILKGDYCFTYVRMLFVITMLYPMD